jgi:hypothetical protein
MAAAIGAEGLVKLSGEAHALDGSGIAVRPHQRRAAG